MAVMKELSLDREELLDNVQKFVLCGRAMLDAMEQIAMQFAVIKENRNKVESTKKAAIFCIIRKTSL